MKILMNLQQKTHLHKDPSTQEDPLDHGGVPFMAPGITQLANTLSSGIVKINIGLEEVVEEGKVDGEVEVAVAQLMRIFHLMQTLGHNLTN